MKNSEPVLELLSPPPVVEPCTKNQRAGLASPLLVYSADGRYVFQRQAHVVRVLHGQSGRVLHECVRATKRSTVRALALHPHNALQLLAAYDDGCVIVWDFIEQKPLVELRTKQRVVWMASSRTRPSQLLLVVVEKVDGKSTWILVEFSLKTKKRGRVLFQSDKARFHTAAMQSYTAPQGDRKLPGDYVVLAYGHKVVTLWLYSEPGAKDSASRSYERSKFKLTHDVTCVAVSQTQREFSVGDGLGQIFRYHLQNPEERTGAPSAAKMHWHSHGVHCLQYSSDGQFLLSGGEEAVLVSWQLESGRRAYLPRLPATIECIAPRHNGGVYAVALVDSVLFQYNAVTREQEWEARGLARAGASAADSLPSRQLVVDPLTKALVLNGSSGAGVLQFYEPFADRVLQTLLLSERNHVTRTEDEEMPVMQASHVCFSPRGDDLATLHAPTTATTGEEQALRFWTRRVDGSFFVNTAVDAPHGRARVTSMALSSSVEGDALVTADDQGDFKIWQKTATEHGAASWHCQSVIRFRDEPVTAVASARDGSLVAVAYGNKLTLWDVRTHTLHRVLPSADGQQIKHIVFPGVSAPFVVLATDEQVQVWNLLTLSLWWRYAVPPQTVLAETPLHERFIVALPVADKSESERESQTLVLTFDAQTPVPTCVRKVKLGTSVWSAGFHPGTGDLMLLDKQTGVWRLDGPQARSLDVRRRKEAHVAAIAARTAAKDGEQETKALSAIYSAASGGRLPAKKTPGVSGAASVNGAASSSLFDAPAHVLPSMTALYRSFMDTMLPKPHQAEADEAKADAASPHKKKNVKRRKKQQKEQTPADAPTGKSGEQRKRRKLQVEKELDPELQKQTYSKLLETFRKRRA